MTTKPLTVRFYQLLSESYENARNVPPNIDRKLQVFFRKMQDQVHRLESKDSPGASCKKGDFLKFRAYGKCCLNILKRLKAPMDSKSLESLEEQLLRSSISNKKD